MAKSILEHFAELPEPRMERTKLHQLGDILAIAIDGKTLRHSFDKANDKAAIHMVSAWAPANHLVFGQIVKEAKSNEFTASFANLKTSFNWPTRKSHPQQPFQCYPF